MAMNIPDKDLYRQQQRISTLPARGPASPIGGGIGDLQPSGPAQQIPPPATRNGAAVSGRSVASQQALQTNMAADRAARIGAMKAGGIDALDDVVSRQSGAVPAARPVTAAVNNPPGAAAPAQPAAYRAGQAARGAADVTGRVARFGAEPVAATPGRIGPRTAPGQGGAGAALLASSAAMTAGESAGRQTVDYRRRAGLSEVESPGLLGLAEDVAARGAGVLSDVGAGILDMPVDIANRFGANLQPFRTFFADRAGEWPENAAAPAAAAPAAGGGIQDMPPMRVTGSPAAQELPAMTVRGGDAGGDSAVSANGRRMGYGRMVDGVPTFSDGSGGGGVPRTMSDTDIADLGARAAQTSGGLSGGGGIADGYQRAARQSDQRTAREDSNYLDLINRDARERSGVRDQSRQRMDKIQGDIDSLLFRGKRRSAAVLADSLRAEAGIAGGAMPGQAPDVRRNQQQPNPSDFAQADNYAASAQNTRSQSARQNRINTLMDSYLQDPQSPEGQRALSAMRAVEGKVTDKLYPVDVPSGIDELGAPQKMRGLADEAGKLVYNPASQSAGNKSGAGQNASGPVEGVTYTDANGNRAVYRGGKYVPTQ